MGSLNSRARPTPGSNGGLNNGAMQTTVTTATAAAGEVRMFRIQETVLLEVRGRRISPQSKIAPERTPIGSGAADRLQRQRTRGRALVARRAADDGKNGGGGNWERRQRRPRSLADSTSPSSVGNRTNSKNVEDSVTINNVDLEEHGDSDAAVDEGAADGGNRVDGNDEQCFGLYVNLIDRRYTYLVVIEYSPCHAVTDGAVSLRDGVVSVTLCHWIDHSSFVHFDPFANRLSKFVDSIAVKVASVLRSKTVTVMDTSRDMF